MSDEIELSIVMPCLNEAKTVGLCIEKALGFLRSHQIRGEVLIGDNGSTDGSIQIAQKLGAVVVPVKERGYGAALRGAILQARGQYVIMGDSDDSYDFSKLMAFVEQLRGGADLVMGNRFRGGIMPGAMPWKNRYIGNPALSFIGRLLFKCRCRDFHCGLRGFRKDAFLKAQLRTSGMEFASEMVIKFTLLGLKVVEVPTILHVDGRGRPPHLRPWRDGWRHLVFMLLHSPRFLFLYPGLALLLCGLGFGGVIILKPDWVNPYGFDIGTLLFCAGLTVMGSLNVQLSLFAKRFAVVQNVLKEDPLLTFFSRSFSLEKGLIAGLLLVLLGCGGIGRAFFNWEAAEFGLMVPAQHLRLLIPSVTALILGAQVIFSSFLTEVFKFEKTLVRDLR